MRARGLSIVGLGLGLSMAPSLACTRDPPPKKLPAQASSSPESPTAAARAPDSDTPTGIWHAELTSPGGALGFELRIEGDAEGLQASVQNGPESLPFSTVEFEADQLVLRMDGYDSEIRATWTPGRLEGEWSKTTPSGRSTLPFAAVLGPGQRLGCAPLARPAPASVTGSWSLSFTEDDGSTYVGRAELEQAEGQVLRGTILTDTGDYRYLEGCYVGGSLGLSVFDGAHAFLVRAETEGEDALRGNFWSRDSYHAAFTATRLAEDAADPLADPWTSIELRPGSDQFRFAFPDLEGREVSHADPRFAGKVTIVDIFGSWCPNCNDQAALLARWDQRYAEHGLEIVGLAYEFTGEPERDREYVAKYAARHGLEFTLLLAGTSDKGDAAETLPDLDRVAAYPTTIFIDRAGKVRKIYSGFFGPATGERHTAMVREHEALIEFLLAEAEPG